MDTGTAELQGVDCDEESVTTYEAPPNSPIIETMTVIPLQTKTWKRRRMPATKCEFARRHPPARQVNGHALPATYEEGAEHSVPASTIIATDDR